MDKNKKEKDIIVLTEMIFKGKTKDGFIMPLPSGTVMQISRTLGEILFLFTGEGYEYTINETRCRAATEAEKFKYHNFVYEKKLFVMQPEKPVANESER